MTDTVTEKGIMRVRDLLKTQQKQIKAKLGQMISPVYFCSAALTMMEKNPDIAKCSDVSIVSALLDAAQLRLIPDGVLGQAYLVPYGGKAVLIPGYKGLVELCLRSGFVRKIKAVAVHANDVFDYEYGMDDFLKHKPAELDPGKLTHVWGMYEMEGGGKDFEVWSYEKLMKHKEKYAKGYKKPESGWVTAEESMCIKTVLRSITKTLPKSIEAIHKFNATEDRMDLGFDLDDDGIIDLDPDEPKDNGKGVAKITKALEEKAKETPEGTGCMFCEGKGCKECVAPEDIPN